jgi:predicted nucleic acid-binding Zn ribbon protein
MTLPSHPGHDDELPVDTTRSRRTNVIIAIVVALVVLVVVLHLTGVIGQ